MSSTCLALMSRRPSSSAPRDSSPSGLSVGRHSSPVSASILASLFPRPRGQVRAVVLYSPGRRQRPPKPSPAEHREDITRRVALSELRGYLQNKAGFVVGTSAARLSKQLVQGRRSFENYVRAKLVGRDWREARSMPSELLFVHATRGLDSPPLSQTHRVLGNEADASTAFVSNVLNPALAVLQHFLAEHLRQYFEIVLLSEVVAEDVEAEPGSASRSSLRLDHVFALVGKQKNAKGERLLRPQKALVIIEMKRYNLVRPGDWPQDLKAAPRPLNKDTDGRAYRLLPQLLMYAHKWRCPRIYLSDYVRCLALDIDFAKLGTKVPVPVAFKFCADASSRCDSVYEASVRAAITFDAVEALRGLGVANRKILGGQHPQLDADLAAHLAAFGRQHAHT